MNISYFIQNKIRYWKINNIRSKNTLLNNNSYFFLNNYMNLLSTEPLDNIESNSERIRYVVFDTETTGLNYKSDKLLSIGAIGIHGSTLTIQDYFYDIIYMERQKGEDIMIHGILPSESRKGKDENYVLQNFINYIGNSVLIAHNIDFDLGFINSALNNYFYFEILNRKIDTFLLAEKIEKKINPDHFIHDRSKFQLDTLLKNYDIPQIARHNSLSDAFSIAILFLKLQSRYRCIGQNKLIDLLCG